MTIQAPIPRKFSRSRPKPRPIPVYTANGPRELTYPNDYRVALIVLLGCFGLLGALGLWLELFGPTKAGGEGVIVFCIAAFFSAWTWAFAWRPTMAAREIVRTGTYATATIVRFECPWWSEVLKALRPFMVIASRAALTAEVGYRLTIEVPDGAGSSRRLTRLIWRAFSNSLPSHGQEVGVFYDPARSDKFIFATDLERLGVAVQGA